MWVTIKCTYFIPRTSHNGWYHKNTHIPQISLIKSFDQANYCQTTNWDIQQTCKIETQHFRNWTTKIPLPGFYKTAKGKNMFSALQFIIFSNGFTCSFAVTEGFHDRCLLSFSKNQTRNMCTFIIPGVWTSPIWTVSCSWVFLISG